MNSEQLNRALYGSKLTAYALMRRTTYVMTILSIALLVYAHGVVESPITLRYLFYAIDGILAHGSNVIFFLRTFTKEVLMRIDLGKLSEYVSMDEIKASMTELNSVYGLQITLDTYNGFLAAL